MDAAKTVQATFSPVGTTYTLDVSLAGTGSGTVTGTGIGCPGDCTEDYSAGTSVTLTASPDGTDVFTGWSGDCTGTGTCTVTMDGVKTVTATFTTPGAGGNPFIIYLDANNQFTELTGYDNVPVTYYYDWGGADTYTIRADLSHSVTLIDNNTSFISFTAGINIDGSRFIENGVQFDINNQIVTLLGSVNNFIFLCEDVQIGTLGSFTETASFFGASVTPAVVSGTQTGTLSITGVAPNRSVVLTPYP
jgi:hypothetical protein